MSDDQPYDSVTFAMQRFMDETEGSDRICNYCFHPRSSDFCKTSHLYPEWFAEQ